MEAGVHINASCGGEGVCGKCRVIIEDGNVLWKQGFILMLHAVEKGYAESAVLSSKMGMLRGELQRI
jgi:ferredoxin